MSVKAIPEGFRTVTPYVIAKDAAGVIEFAKHAFGATEIEKHQDSRGRITHATIKIGDSMVMLGQASDDWEPMPCMLHLYVPDADATYKRAIEAGAKVVRELRTEFYGDRSGGVVDSSGNQWWIATHVEDVPPEEMERRMKAR